MAKHEDYNVIDINDLELDREVLRQPIEMLRCGRKIAKLRLKHSEAKAALDLVRADLSLDIRNNPEKYNLEKSSRGTVTESTIESAIIVSEEFKEAIENLNQAKFRLDELEALSYALNHRKSMLELRIQLLSMEWHANVREGKHGGRVMEEMMKSSRKSIKKKR